MILSFILLQFTRSCLSLSLSYSLRHSCFVPAPTSSWKMARTFGFYFRLSIVSSISWVVQLYDLWKSRWAFSAWPSFQTIKWGEAESKTGAGRAPSRTAYSSNWSRYSRAPEERNCAPLFTSDLGIASLMLRYNLFASSSFSAGLAIT